MGSFVSSVDLTYGSIVWFTGKGFRLLYCFDSRDYTYNGVSIREKKFHNLPVFTTFKWWEFLVQCHKSPFSV